MASREFLDTKYFIKEYHYISDSSAKTFRIDKGDRLGIFCTIVRKLHHHRNKMKMPPQECIMVNKGATLGEVHTEAERVFREIYWELRDVVMESVVDGQREITREDEMDLMGKKGFVLEGNIVGMMMKIKVMKCHDEDKRKEKRIECECRAKEEDGGRMVCCDICEVWENTRCVSTQQSEEVPNIFICQSCDQHPIPRSLSVTLTNSWYIRSLSLNNIYFDACLLLSHL